jgi:hypothetical protein
MVATIAPNRGGGFAMSTRALLLLVALLALVGIPSERVSADDGWELSGPFNDRDGVATCQAISPERLGLRMRSDDSYLMAFFDLRAGEHPFIDDIRAAGELIAIVQAGMEYVYTTRLSIFDTRVDQSGTELHLVGLSGTDFHLIEAMKRADYLYVVVTKDWPERMFDLKRDDYAIRYDLRGASSAIAQTLDCAGYRN